MANPISAAQQKHQIDNPQIFTTGNPVTLIISRPPNEEKKITNIYYDSDTKEIVADVED